MKLVGLMPVRNEAWCLGLTARAALMWCDELVILLHACTDESLQIVADIQSEVTDRISYFRVEGEWDEMQHRQTMLTGARDEHQATHIAIIDADEILTGNLLGLEYWRSLRAGQIMQLPGYNLRCGLARYHNSGIWGFRWFSTVFRDSPDLHWAGDQFHHREPWGRDRLQIIRPINQGAGGVMHLWGVSERRLRAKHALYKVTERLRWPGKPPEQIDSMYSLAIHGRDKHDCPATWTYALIPPEWWKPYDHLMEHLHLDESLEPWQETETRRLVTQHGAEMFRDFDLFGIA